MRILLSYWLITQKNISACDEWFFRLLLWNAARDIQGNFGRWGIIACRNRLLLTREEVFWRLCFAVFRAEPSLARPAKVAVTCCSASFIRHYVGGVIIGHSVVCQHLLQHTGPQFSVDLSRFRGRSRGCVAVFLRCSLSSAVAEISLVSHYSESH